MPVDDIVAPQAASMWWTIGGIAILLVVISWITLVLLMTRHSPKKVTAPEPVPTFAAGGDPFAALRLTYLAKVDAAEQAYTTEEIDIRELHLRLSAIVREFAGKRRGVDTTVMTLTEIERLTGAGHLAHLIALYYQPAFAETTQGSSIESIDGARTVISRW